MATLAQRFNKFLQNIQLTVSQIDDARTKHTGVSKVLHDHYYRFQSYANYEILQEQSTSSTSYLVGSYGKNTAIRPPSDVDILFIMPVRLFSKYNDDYRNGQSRLLQDVKNVLIQPYPRTVIRGDRQVVSVEFTSYAVEVLPVFARNYQYYKFPDTRAGGSWRDTNPKAEKSALISSNKTTKGKTIRLIKMMKAWKRYCNVPLSSLGIELTVVNFLNAYRYSDVGAAYYGWMVRDYLNYLIQHKNRSYQIPGISERLDIGDSWLSRAETAHNRAKKACDYEDSEHYDLATDEWKKIFGKDFEYLD